jgi:hypothetical protein
VSPIRKYVMDTGAPFLPKVAAALTINTIFTFYKFIGSASKGRRVSRYVCVIAYCQCVSPSKALSDPTPAYSIKVTRDRKLAGS